MRWFVIFVLSAMGWFVICYSCDCVHFWTYLRFNAQPLTSRSLNFLFRVIRPGLNVVFCMRRTWYLLTAWMRLGRTRKRLAVSHVDGCSQACWGIVKLVHRSHCRCENVRSGKVRFKAISGWLREERVPNSNLFWDLLFLCSIRRRIESKAPVSQLMDEEHYNIFYLEQLYFLKKKKKKLSKNPVRFVSAPLSGTHLGKLEPFTH